MKASKNDCVWSDPETLGGVLCFTNTRVPVHNFFEHLEAGGTVEDFLTGYPRVRREQVTGLFQQAELLHLDLKTPQRA